MVWQILHEKDAIGPILKLQKMWRDLPAPDARQQDALRAKCVQMRDFVVRIRNHSAMQFAAPEVKGLPAQSQPLLNWKLREFAAHRRDSDPHDLRNDTDPPEVEALPEVPQYAGLHEEAAPRWSAGTSRSASPARALAERAAQRGAASS